MSVPIEPILFLFLLAVAVMVIRVRDLFAAAMLTGIFSLISAALFTILDAVDVAFTEAAVGAGVSTILILATLSLTGARERPARNRRSHQQALLVVSLTGAALIYGTLDMPHYGDPNAPIHQHLIQRYIVGSLDEIGLPNFVTSILASYRGYDTFGELSVIFTAGTAVALILSAPLRELFPSKAPSSSVAAESLGSTPPPRKMRMSETHVLRTVSKALIPFILLFALYVQFHGDFGPGGGFQAGVIFAAGLIVYALIYGPEQLARVISLGSVRWGASLGLLLYGGTGLACIVLGAEFLNYNALDPSHPSHGQHLGISLVELGVGVTVAAVMVSIYYAFAARPESRSK